jgi:regulator of extracellular matrix RemA (YlzA/DUF370 family)
MDFIVNRQRANIIFSIVAANSMLTIVGTLLGRIDEVEADAVANASMLRPTIPKTTVSVVTTQSSAAIEAPSSEKKKRKKKKHDKEMIA